MPHDEKEFEAQMDVDTLKRAEEIKNDPERSEAAKKKAEKEIVALKSIKGKTFVTGNRKTLITG